MITNESLVKAGYQQYNCTSLREFTNTFWCKAMDDENGVKAYIYLADYTATPNIKDYFSYEAFCEFQTSNNFTVTLSGINKDITAIESIESFFEDMWFKLACNYAKLY